MIAPIDKLTALLSEDIVSLFGDDVLNDTYIGTFKNILNLMTDDSVIEALTKSNLSITPDKIYTPHTTTTDLDCIFSKREFTKGRRILSVERYNYIGTDYDDTYYKCSKQSTIVGQSGILENVNSIHLSNDRWSPSYFVSKAGGIEIKPKDTILSTAYFPKGRVWWITYPTFKAEGGVTTFNYTFNLSGKNISGLSKDEEEIILYGIPLDAKELFYVQFALNLCQYFVADFVHEEEDTELLALVKEQASILMAKRTEEMQSVLPIYGSKKKGSK